MPKTRHSFSCNEASFSSNVSFGTLCRLPNYPELAPIERFSTSFPHSFVGIFLNTTAATMPFASTRYGREWTSWPSRRSNSTGIAGNSTFKCIDSATETIAQSSLHNLYVSIKYVSGHSLIALLYSPLLPPVNLSKVARADSKFGR